MLTSGRKWGMFVVIFMFFSVSTWAVQIPWHSKVCSYIAKGEDIREVLKNLCATQGIPVVISQEVHGIVNGNFTNVSPQTLLETLASAYGFLWYFDGHVLYIYGSEEISSVFLQLQYESVSRLINVLKRLGIYDERFPIKVIPDEGIIWVIGPPRYVELVSQTVSMLDKSFAEEEIRIFKLKYAWAADHTFVVQDQQITVPGVATILQNILMGQTPANASPQVKRLAHTLQKLRGKGLAAIGRESQKKEKNKEKKRKEGGEEKEKKSSSPTTVSPRIVADSRLNAVIIRDIKERMPLYEQLISLLDVPAGLVQIEVTISDVSIDNLKELGFNWRLNTTSSNDKYKFDVGISTPQDFTPGADWLSVGEGLNMATTISLGMGRYLLSYLRALEQKGKAKILSQPSVLTINNVQAVIEQTRTFYARVAGEHDVDLFNVTAGITLKVTPHIIEGAGKKKIKLIVDIEDGTIQSDQTVDNLPVVPKSAIHTQAIVNEDQILVLGGCISEMRNRVTKSVPILGKLPLLGFLFRYNTEQKTRQERIFMIHPKILYSSIPERTLPKNE